jgi:hypothetical protein
MPIDELKEGDIKDKKRKAVARAHGFRKFATNKMIEVRLTDFAREKLLGRSSTGVLVTLLSPKN